jgi:hypothetical protein
MSTRVVKGRIVFRQEAREEEQCSELEGVGSFFQIYRQLSSVNLVTFGARQRRFSKFDGVISF